jgi:uncharacterized protein YbaA (DUF1428 family)
MTSSSSVKVLKVLLSVEIRYFSFPYGERQNEKKLKIRDDNNLIFSIYVTLSKQEKKAAKMTMYGDKWILPKPFDIRGAF